MSSRTRSYLTATLVCLFFVAVHLAGMIDFGGFAIGLRGLAAVFGILAIVGFIQDKKANDGRP